MRSISEVWERIRAHQNEHFETVRGLPFTYAVTGNELITDRSDFPLHASQFEKTLELLPLDRPGKINDLVHGPSYVWAMLHDARIRGSDW